MSSIFFSLLSHIDLAFSSLCVRLSSLNSFSLARFRHLAPAISPPCSHGEKKGGSGDRRTGGGNGNAALFFHGGEPSFGLFSQVRARFTFFPVAPRLQISSEVVLPPVFLFCLAFSFGVQ